MALLPFTVAEPECPSSPLVVDVPHCGRIYPMDFAFNCSLRALRLSEDAYVDEVVSCATAAGASVLMAEFPRSMIDANRAEDDIDPANLHGEWSWPANPTSAALAGYGLVRRLCGSNVPVYRNPLKVEEVRRRLNTYYRPYHAKLKELVESRKQEFGFCLLLDTHSMPSRAENGSSSPDFVLGDLDGTSCTTEFTGLACKILQEQGYTVAVNAPYKGREILRRYGNPEQGAYALQIEINRRLYLDEASLIVHAGLPKLREHISRLFSVISQLRVSAGR